ncbi:MAG: penicillin amidase [Methylococcaceae bacterium NSP1-2]|nr:MAG: penicillin amidase [Methylococcaceae bacterium NSP1-2]
MFKRGLFYTCLLSVVLIIIALAGGFLWLQQSSAQLDGEVSLNKLSAPVTVNSDGYGIPVIHATTRLDAVRSLGYLNARDRLFQMDLMRRKNAGRLAELFGQIALDSDIKARTYGFYRLANVIGNKLPAEHKAYLQAYADGVNSFISTTKTLPFEFTVLGYQPETWQIEDSILVALGMFDMLTAWTEEEERMLTVMEKTLPADIVAFLTPDTDRFTDSLLHNAPSARPIKPIPVAALHAALAPSRRVGNAFLPTNMSTNYVQLRDFFVGSNAWAVSGAKTHDGRAILANDMHLGLSVPTLWYRCEMNIGKARIAGVMLPGTPLLIAGSNEFIAWGSTNLSGDFLDLVSLEINPDNANEYKVGNDWQAFENIGESITVKGESPQQITVKHTIWGPVAPQPLLNKSVAIHWTALDSDAVNMGLMDLEAAQSLEQAVSIVNRAGGPQLNMLFADNSGHIAWTLMGKIPKRYGNDGAVSRSWANGNIGWQGYIDADELPRQINPPEGVLVSANDRRLGTQYPYTIGRQFADGYRAYRITQRLNELTAINEWSLFALQLDTESEPYRFYQQLALSVLSPKLIAQQPELGELRDYLLAWDGKANTDSLGFALLVKFRQQLAKSVFTPFLTAAKQADKDFDYSWTYIDVPLQALLTEKPASLLPDSHYADWNAFILGQLTHSAAQLKAKHPDKSLAELTWGNVNIARVKHPFSNAIPLLGWLLDMPENELAGCAACVRVAGADFGASERMVVSPAHLDEGILHIPAGQSAHPLSPYYRDQQAYWVHGLPISLLTGKSQHSLVFKPDAQ